MPSVITHAVVGYRLAQGLERKRLPRLPLLLVAAGLAALPDLDYFARYFLVEYGHPCAHRGLTHSIFFAVAIALIASFLFWRYLGKWRDRLALWGVLAVATASHGVLDAMTDGGAGVAFLAPFSESRYFFFWRPIRVSPLGVTAFFGRQGLFALVSEIVVVWIPLAVVAHLRSARFRLSWVAPAMGTILATVFMFGLRSESSLYGTSWRDIALVTDSTDPNHLARLPAAFVPEGRLVTKLPELESLGLFGSKLVPALAVSPWSSGYFPIGYGGVAQRWQDPIPRLLLRSTFGTSPPAPSEARAWLAGARAGSSDAIAQLYRLSATEKFDLAVGDPAFSVTRRELQLRGHNRIHANLWGAMAWHGFCAGASIAAMTYPEPYREVTVIARDGSPVVFHPMDIKALLFLIHEELPKPRGFWRLGARCSAELPYSPGCRDLNAGSLVLVLANFLGRGRQALFVDEDPLRAVFHMPIVDATLERLGPVYEPSQSKGGFFVPPEVALLADVRVTLGLSSTMVPSGTRPRALPTPEGAYERTGLVRREAIYRITLALDRDLAIIGGRYDSARPDWPDYISGFQPKPIPPLPTNTFAPTNPLVSRQLVAELARLAADSTSDRRPEIDLRSGKYAALRGVAEVKD